MRLIWRCNSRDADLAPKIAASLRAMPRLAVNSHWRIHPIRAYIGFGVLFALHTKPHAKRSEIKSHEVQIQSQLHNPLSRQKDLYTPKRNAKRGFTEPFRRPMRVSRNQADALGIPRDSVTACDRVTARYRNNAAPTRRPVAGPQEGA
jgi:hypothetical protein